MTYGVWAPPLPIPLRVQFSDKQKHIQALASHFTLCALAGGNAFLEPLAYSPKNGSSWLSFFFFLKKREGGGKDATCGGLGPIFHPPRSLLALYYQSHHCSRWAGEPAPVDTLMHASYSFSTSNTQHELTWLSLSISVPPSPPPSVHRDCKHWTYNLSVCALSLFQSSSWI